MKDLIITISIMWTTFCLFMIPLLIGAYDGKGDVGELYFKLENSLYYVGYLGEVE